MTLENSSMDEARIRDLVEARINAIAAKDVDACVADHAAGVVVYDVVEPIGYRGRDAVRERTREWLSLYDGEIGYEVRDLTVTAGGEVGFCHYLYRVSGTRKDGVAVRMWVRATLCFRKEAGDWRLTHEHDSVPFDPDSGLASLDLEPDLG